MKKIVAMLLALIMVMGLATVVSAETPSATPSAVTLKKAYDDEISKETISFSVVADTNNPDTSLLPTIEAKVYNAATNDVTVTFPAYSKVGTYKYTITEVIPTGDAEKTQGMTYETAPVTILVLVAWNDEHTALTATAGIENTATAGETAAKNDTFTNTLKAGQLTVSKNVEGNLASTTQKFDITVKFTATQKVYLDIVNTTEDPDTVAVEGNGWTGTKEVQIQLANDESITFDNIPAGVTYEVIEDSKHAAEDVNGSDASKGYNVTYTYSDETDKKISDNDTDTVAVKNSKSTQINTGIAMDSVPFIVMAVIAVMGLAAFTAKKRVQE